MTSPWISVESTSITISRMPWRSRSAGWTATSTAWRGGLRGQRHPQPVRVGAGDVQLDRGDRVARHPLDPVDVRAGVGDPAGDRGDRRGLAAACPSTVTWLRPSGAAAVVAGAAVDLDLHAEVVGDPLQRAAQRLPVARRGDQHAEHQPAAEHDLLDVEHLDAERGQGGEDRRGDARPVLAGERDQQGLRRLVVHVAPEANGPTGTSRRPPGPVSQRGRAARAPAGGRPPRPR